MNSTPTYPPHECEHPITEHLITEDTGEWWCDEPGCGCHGRLEGDHLPKPPRDPREG